MMSVLQRTWPTMRAALAISVLVVAALYSADRLDREARTAALTKRTDPVVTGSIIAVAAPKATP